MYYDLIMVAASRSEKLIEMTQRAIDSCLADGDKVNVILVETYNETQYKGVDKLIMFDREFNYNGCLNEGLKYREGHIQILANNDIIFQKGWGEAGYWMEANKILSASPIGGHAVHSLIERGDRALPGYEIGIFFTGWCIFQHKKVWDKIGALSEKNIFWGSDNAHVKQLIDAKIKHYLLCNIEVHHLTSETLKGESREAQLKFIRYDAT